MSVITGVNPSEGPRERAFFLTRPAPAALVAICELDQLARRLSIAYPRDIVNDLSVRAFHRLGEVMAIRHKRQRPSVSAASTSIVVLLTAAILAVWPGSGADAAADVYRIGWHAITNGVSRSSSACYGLSGTVGQPASGYAMGTTYALVSGYLAAASTSGRDAIFHTGP